ncbi:MAG: hypothetical protein EON88_15330 [Brevundimonas sp.]|nr:MAG: hypothetical protein EON88_15330 [Brevundimonas sp.]
MAKSKNTLFTAQERRIAGWTLAAVVAVTSFGVLVEQAYRRPSLGPDGADSFQFAPLPGVSDARPIA